jgi:hypothetical protein
MTDQNNQRFDKYAGQLIVAIVLIFIISSIVEFYARSKDNQARAEHWTKLEVGQDRIRAMLNKQYSFSQLSDEHLRQCNTCHNHPHAKGIIK